MSKSAQNCSHLQEETPYTVSWQLLLLRRCICPVSLHWYLPPLSWGHQWMQVWYFKLGVWPTPTESCRGCNQGNAEAKRPPTVMKWFFLLWTSSGWFWSREQFHHLVATYWLNRWRINCFQPDQIVSRSSKVLVTSMLTCPLPPPSTLQPAPFYPWAEQTHVITLLFPSQIYLLVFGILWHPGHIIFSIFGLVEEDTISHHSQQGAQGVSNCKW